MNQYIIYNAIYHVLICRQCGCSIPNHYSKGKRLVVSKFLCGKLWVRFPIKIKMTVVFPHKKRTTTLVYFDIGEGKMFI